MPNTMVRPETGHGPARDFQIRTAAKLLGTRDTAAENVPAAYISRAAVLRLVISWALQPMAETTPSMVSRTINETVGQSSGYGDRVNAILAYLRTGAAIGGLPPERAAELALAYRPLTKGAATELIKWLHTLPEVS